MSGASVVSATDIRLYVALANPENTRVSDDPIPIQEAMRDRPGPPSPVPEAATELDDEDEEGANRHNPRHHRVGAASDVHSEPRFREVDHGAGDEDTDEETAAARHPGGARGREDKGDDEDEAQDDDDDEGCEDEGEDGDDLDEVGGDGGGVGRDDESRGEQGHGSDALGRLSPVASEYDSEVSSALSGVDAASVWSDTRSPPRPDPAGHGRGAHRATRKHRPRAPPHAKRTSPRERGSSRSAMRSDAGDDLLLEKQSVLLELERLRGQGITLSKLYTLDDRIEDMEFEVRRHLLNAEERRSVEFMRDSMRLMFTGIEIANGKLGPFLDLDGWAADIGKDINKYDSALSRLYRKYWRRSAMSPEMELAVGVLRSMGMFHF